LTKTDQRAKQNKLQKHKNVTTTNNIEIWHTLHCSPEITDIHNERRTARRS